MSAPIRIMDLGRAFRANVGIHTAAAQEPGEVASSSNSPALPLEVASFLTTSKGLQWFTEVLADWERKLPQVRAPTASELNRLVIKKYEELMLTNLGRKLREGGPKGDRYDDALGVPIYILEDFVSRRLQAKLSQSWRRVALQVINHCAIASASLTCIRWGLRWLVRRWKRAVRVVDFAFDVLLPTQFYGPLLGLVVVLLKLCRVQPIPPP